MTETRKVCVCHKQPAETRKGKYYCPIEHHVCVVETRKMKINLPRLDETWDGTKILSPKELDDALIDYKKKAAGE